MNVPITFPNHLTWNLLVNARQNDEYAFVHKAIQDLDTATYRIIKYL